MKELTAAERRELVRRLLPEADEARVEFLVHMPEAKRAVARYRAELADITRDERTALRRVYEAAGYRLPERTS